MNDRAQPIMAHIGELRRRMVRAAFVVLITTVAAFVFYQPIAEFVQQPAQDALKSVDPESDARLIFIDVFEGWSVTAKISVLVGFAAALPYVMWELVMFLRPGLSGRERKYLYLMLPGGTLLFFAGAAFGYYILIPPAIRFLFEFGSDIAAPTPRLGSYVNLITSLVFWMGMVFEIPIIMFLLAKAGILKSRWLRRQRRWNILFAFVLGAIITPTFDPVTQSLAAGPVIVLFELGVLLVRYAERTGTVGEVSPAPDAGDTGGSVSPGGD